MFPLQKCSFENLKILRIVANLHGCENCLAAVRDKTWRPCDMSNAKNSCKLTCWPPWIVGSLVLKRFNIEWQPSVTKHDGQVWHEQCEKLMLSHFRLACMNRGSLVLKLLIMNFNLNFLHDLSLAVCSTLFPVCTTEKISFQINEIGLLTVQ